MHNKVQGCIETGFRNGHSPFGNPYLVVYILGGVKYIRVLLCLGLSTLGFLLDYQNNYMFPLRLPQNKTKISVSDLKVDVLTCSARNFVKSFSNKQTETKKRWETVENYKTIWIGYYKKFWKLMDNCVRMWEIETSDRLWTTMAKWLIPMFGYSVTASHGKLWKIEEKYRLVATASYRKYRTFFDYKPCTIVENYDKQWDCRNLWKIMEKSDYLWREK